MEAILVPVDFSPTSLNATDYAINFAKQVGGKIILLNAFEAPLVYPLYEGVEISHEGLKQINKKELIQLAEQLSNQEPLIKIEYLLKDGSLTYAIEETLKTIDVSLIIMGITGAGKIKETIIGSNTLLVAKHSTIPVLIIPEDCVYSKVNEIGITTDFRDVVNTIPDKLVKHILQMTGAKLHVLNVDFDNRQWTDDTPFQSGLVETMFENFTPKYHFIDHEDMVSGLNEYVDKFGIKLLIAFPQKHNLLEKIFSSSHTKELAFHSKIPVMIIHF
jgi:nucleotide-binding universal stress UspA family protein